MKEQKAFKPVLALFILALPIATYLVYDHYKIINGEDFNSICNIDGYFNCDTVNSSVYSTFLGVSLGAWGLSYYLFGILLAAMAVASPYAVREVSLLLVPSAIVSVLSSALLLYISVFRIGAMCLFCTALYVINLLSAGFILRGGWSVVKSPLKELKKMDRSRLGFFAVLGLVTVGIVAIGSAQLKNPLPFDMAVFTEALKSQKPVSVEPGHSPRLGSMSDQPKIRLVEFSDFQCPFCARQAKELHRIVSNYKKDVQLVFKHYPLDMSCNPDMKRPLHHNACQAARAAWCAQQQGKFEPLASRMFSRQKELGIENILRWAVELGMDQGQFERCLGSPEARAAVDADVRMGSALGVNSTPMFFINGRKHLGLVTVEAIGYLLAHPEVLQSQ